MMTTEHSSSTLKFSHSLNLESLVSTVSCLTMAQYVTPCAPVFVYVIKCYIARIDSTLEHYLSSTKQVYFCNFMIGLLFSNV